MSANEVVLELEVTIGQALWQTWGVLCEAQGEDPERALAEMITMNMQLMLEDLAGVTDGAVVDAGERDRAYEDAVTALSAYWSAEKGIPLLQAEHEAIALLKGDG